jgi:predicted nuclease of predicted toxin-antitoxin system
VNFLADECCDAFLVDGLRGDGHDVLYVKESAPGTDDHTVLQMAADQERVLLTEDKDFGELVVRLKLPAYGIVFLRMNPADSAAQTGPIASSSPAPRATPARLICCPHSQEGAFSLVVRGCKRQSAGY